MQTLYWNLDTRAVSTERYSQSDPTIESTRGDEAVQVILLQGGVPVLLDADGAVGVVVRPASNPKQGCLAGPTALTRGANGAAGYTGTTSTDSALTREVMHVDGADPAAELPSFAGEAVFYFAPAGDADPYESLPFPVTILPDYYRPGQLPATPAEDYPPAGDVDTVAARDTAIAAALAALPASGGTLPGTLTGLVYANGANPPAKATGAQVAAALVGQAISAGSLILAGDVTAGPFATFNANGGSLSNCTAIIGLGGYGINWGDGSFLQSTGQGVFQFNSGSGADGTLNLANVNASGDINADGSLSVGGNLSLSSTLTGYNGQTILDQYSNIYTNGSVAAEDGYYAGGFFVADGSYLFAAGDVIADGDNLYANNSIFVNGSIVTDGTALYLDNVRVLDSSTLLLNGGFALWGKVSPPNTQPATPTSLAGVISVLQAYGLCQ